MRKTLLLLALPATALLAREARCPTPPVTYELVISHVSVVDVVTGRLHPDQTVAVAGGKIVRVGPATARY
ncbi:MAG: hypothetical protein EOO62_10715, partial [Hymenobacter sp.]